MKLLFAVAPEDYRDEEFEIPAAIFQKEGIQFDISSTREGTCKGMLGGRITATRSFYGIFEKEQFVEYDGIVIIGGSGSPVHLWKNRDLIELIKVFDLKEKVIAAICLAPVALSAAGIMKGKNATVFKTHNAVHELMKGDAIYIDQPVVVDGKIVTGNGPKAAQQFAETIIEVLNGTWGIPKTTGKLGFAM
jgi:protease I